MTINIVKLLKMIYFAIIKWNEQLIVLTERVSKELNCEGKLKAEFNKLILHKTGSIYTRHVNVHKETSPFATLIIKLPSVYTGGELVVYDHAKVTKRVYDFDNVKQESVFSIQYVAHLENLEHELLRVEAGYRLLLVYSLLHKDSTKVSEAEKDHGCNSDLIDEIYSHLLRATYSQKSLSFLLDNQYAKETIRISGIDALKGITFF